MTRTPWNASDIALRIVMSSFTRERRYREKPPTPTLRMRKRSRGRIPTKRLSSRIGVRSRRPSGFEFLAFPLAAETAEEARNSLRGKHSALKKIREFWNFPSGHANSASYVYFNGVSLVSTKLCESPTFLASPSSHQRVELVRFVDLSRFSTRSRRSREKVQFQMREKRVGNVCDDAKCIRRRLNRSKVFEWYSHFKNDHFKNFSVRNLQFRR